MNDLISRQAAIDALDKIFPTYPMKNDFAQGLTCGAALATEYIKQLPSAQPNVPDTNVGDLISRQAAIALAKDICVPTKDGAVYKHRSIDPDAIRNLPPAQQTLYGYKVEHLAYIARVMEKEGVTAEYAVRTFDDMGRAMKMIIEEAQQKVEETLNERFNKQAGGD